MNAYREFGGFLEMETGRGNLYHDNATCLNSARNALKYIIRLHGIKRLRVPDFTCPVIWHAIKEEDCEIIFYAVNKKMEPVLQGIQSDEYILCNNYFGVQSQLVKTLAAQYPNLIVDNAQAFFSPHHAKATIYSPRKFFGLPDGGMAITRGKLDEQFVRDHSWQRCMHLLKRHDLGANAAYADFCEADSQLNAPEIRLMSNLTKNFMSGIDYAYVKERRRENFALLHHTLSPINRLDITLTDDDVPMVYPLLIEQEGIKAKLIAKKVYVATYWPHLEEVCAKESDALYLKHNLIPLPLDQRYGHDDIVAMLKIVQDVLAGNE